MTADTVSVEDARGCRAGISLFPDRSRGYRYHPAEPESQQKQHKQEESCFDDHQADIPHVNFRI